MSAPLETAPATGVPLSISSLGVHYRGVRAVLDVSLEVPGGACVGVIGANGAGKTSLLRGVSGIVHVARETQIRIGGDRIEHLRPEHRARHGLGHVLEGRHIFPTLTVRENLELGAAASGGTRAERNARVEGVFDHFPLLRPLLRKRGASLSGGQQQFLAIARALAAGPQVLLLDEPSVGLAPELVDDLGVTIRSLADTGVTILLVEQALTVVQAAASTVYAISHGRLVGETVASDPRLSEWAHEVYLG